MSRKNGGIIGPANTPVGGLFKGVAGGVWRMNDVANFVGNSQWPTGPQSIDNSLRFERSSSDYLSKTFGSGGNRKTATQSFWLKRSLLSTNMMLGLTNYPSGSYYGIQALTDDVLDIYLYYNGSAWEGRLKTNRVFRDVSSWYHFVLAWDTTQSTASDRLKFYVNGVQETSFSVETYPDQNQDLDWNNNIAHQINSGGGGAFSGYLAEMVFIDGQQLDPTSFAEFDTTTGIWKPKKIGSFTSAGTNSFYLDFKDSSNVGKDASGLSNNFTVNNLTSIDQATDTCVENYATLNPLDVYASKTGTLSEGNLKLTVTASNVHTAVGTIAASNGKWYFEVELDAISGSNNSNVGISDLARDDKSNMPSKNAWGYGYNPDGTKQNSASDSSYGNSYTAGDILGVAMDLDNGAVYFSKNGTFQASGDPTSGSSKTNAAFTWTPDASMNWVPYVADNTSSVAFTWLVNFGNPPFSISSGNSDANGFGNFEYAVPSGYYALNTSNLNTYG
jgi:hypothetical protein